MQQLQTLRSDGGGTLWAILQGEMDEAAESVRVKRDGGD